MQYTSLCLLLAAIFLRTGTAQVADQFDQAGPIAWGNGATVPIDFSKATIEMGEAADLDDEQASLTVWGTWTPEEAGTYVISTNVAKSAVRVSVYTGDARNHLTRQGISHAGSQEILYRRVVDVDAGVRYLVRFELAPEALPGVINISLEKRLRPNPNNEAYLQAVPVASIDGNVSVRGRYLGEALWWRWTVPESGFYEIDRGDEDAIVGIGIATESEERFDNLLGDGQSGDILLLEFGKELAIKLSSDFIDKEVSLSMRRVEYPQAEVTSKDTPIDLGRGMEVSVSRTILRESRESSVFREERFANHWKWKPSFTGLAQIDIDYWSGSTTTLSVSGGHPKDFVPSGFAGTAEKLNPYMQVVSGQEVLLRLSSRQSLTSGAVAFTLRPATAPSNDAFVNARELGVGNEFSLDLLQDLTATSEPSEPIHGSSLKATSAHSLWWKWSPRTAGVFTLSATKKNLSVYRGDQLMQLESIASGRESVSLIAQPNIRYHIATSTDEPAEGGTLSISQSHRVDVPQPPNASWETAVDLGNDRTVSFSGRHGTGSPAWWQWVAPETGVARFLIAGPDNLHRPEPFRIHEYRDGKLQIFLDGVERGFDVVRFAARAGAHYFFEILGDGEPFTADVRILTSEFPGNVTSDDAEAISQTPFSTTSLIRAPNNELWWRWTPETNGFYDLRVIGIGIVGAIDVFDSKNASAVLTPNTYLPQLGFYFEAKADETYHLRLRSPDWHHAYVSLELQSLSLQPYADERVDPIDLGSSETIRYETTLSEATPSEAAEDYDDVWFRWTAPRSGLLDIDIDTNETLVWFGAIDEADLGEARLPRYVKKGNVYLIRVGQRGGHGDKRIFALRLDLKAQQDAYTNWLETNGFRVGGPGEDPDRNGINNLLELVLGGDPLRRSVSEEEWAARPRIEYGQDQPVFRCHVSEAISFGSSPITVYLETSNDLLTWEQRPLDYGEIMIPLAATSRAYYRLRVVQP